jgi:hypothetical protein
MAQAGVAAPAPASYPYYRLTLLAPLLPAIHTHLVARLGAADKQHRAVALEHVPRVPVTAELVALLWVEGSVAIFGRRHLRPR